MKKNSMLPDYLLNATEPVFVRLGFRPPHIRMCALADVRNRPSGMTVLIYSIKPDVTEVIQVPAEGMRFA